MTGRIWKGSAFGGARGRSDVPKIVNWYMEGKICIDDPITHTTPLEKINGAFDLMHEGKFIRLVVVFQDQALNTIHHPLEFPEQADRLRVEKGQDLAEENARCAAAGVYPMKGIAQPCPGKAPR